MTASILVPLLTLVLGALVYAFAPRDPLKDMGRLAFFCGLFWLVYVFARVHVTF